MKNEVNGMHRLFYPRSIAVVGASPKKGKGWSSGNAYIQGSIRQGFSGRIYPVHPTADSILGYAAYRNVREIPGEVDLVVFTVPATVALGVLDDCVAKGVKFAHFLTAGFTETGRPELADMEKHLAETARKGGIRVVGPNCMGLYCPDGGLSFNDWLPTRSGRISVFSQSGQLATNLIREGSPQGLGFGKVISYGNAIDLKAVEYLDYFSRDDETDVIGAYIEGLQDGRAFFETARGLHKPLVVWKGGRTEGGSRATRSHTAAIAGSQDIWRAMCRQVGIVPVYSMNEFVYTLSALQRLPLPAGLNVAVLGGAGGGSVTMTDAAEHAGLKVPELSPATISGLETFVPLEGSSPRNPLDILPALHSRKNLERIIDLLREDDRVDALMFLLPLPFYYVEMGRSSFSRWVDLTIQVRERLGKPILFVLEQDADPRGETIRKEVESWYLEADVATFPSFDLAARVLFKLKQYRDHLEARLLESTELPPLGRPSSASR
ncbi:MAG: CoA-binding protein [Proteobacteria bacterium]|nr:CoA-binding protein [Pseudomonadota bacterium]